MLASDGTTGASYPGGKGRRGCLLAAGVGIVAVLLLVALSAPWIAPHDPLKPLPGGLTADQTPVPPGPGHWFGTDSQGRDVLSRVIHGARLSLGIGLGGICVALALMLTAGVTAGYFRGWRDGALMRLTDIVLAFPTVLLALALAALLPQRTEWSLAILVGSLSWAGGARVIRGEVMSLRDRLYVDAARAMGAGTGRIVLRHILPQLAPTLLVLGSLGIAATILLEAGLSFLGVGISPPAPSWGGMLQEAQQWYSAAPWLAIAPGAAILTTVAAFHLIAFDLQRSPRTGP